MNKQSFKKQKSRLMQLKKNRFFKKTVASFQEKPNASKSPNIYRTITEHFSKHLKNHGLQILIAWVSVTLLVTIVFVGIDLYSTIKQKQKLGIEREKILSEIKLWQDVAKKYRGYRDAYFALAVLEYRLGKYDKAKYYLKETLNLDPSFEKARELEKLLEGK